MDTAVWCAFVFLRLCEFACARKHLPALNGDERFHSLLLRFHANTSFQKFHLPFHMHARAYIKADIVLCACVCDIVRNKRSYIYWNGSFKCSNTIRKQDWLLSSLLCGDWKFLMDILALFLSLPVQNTIIPIYIYQLERKRWFHSLF